MTKKLEPQELIRVGYEKWVKTFRPYRNYRQTYRPRNPIELFSFDSVDEIPSAIWYSHQPGVHRHVWSLVDWDGVWYIVPGVTRVNALKVLITAEPWGRITPVKYG